MESLFLLQLAYFQGRKSHSFFSSVFDTNLGFWYISASTRASLVALVVTLAILAKLAHFYFFLRYSQQLGMLSFLYIQFGSLYCKQYEPRSDCSLRRTASMVKSELH